MKKVSTIFRGLVTALLCGVLAAGSLLRAEETDARIYKKVSNLTELGLTNDGDQAEFLITNKDESQAAGPFATTGIGGRRGGIAIIRLSKGTVKVIGNRVAQNATDNLPFSILITKVSENGYTLRDTVHHKYWGVGADGKLNLADNACEWQLAYDASNNLELSILNGGTRRYLMGAAGSFTLSDNNSANFAPVLYKKVDCSLETTAIYLQTTTKSTKYIKGKDIRDSVWVVGGCLKGDMGISKNGSAPEGVSFSPASVTAAQAAAGFYLTFTYKNFTGESYSNITCDLSTTGLDPVSVKFSGSAYPEVASLKELLTKTPTNTAYRITGGVVVTTHASVGYGNNNNSVNGVWLQDTAKDGAGILFNPTGSSKKHYKRGDVLSDFMPTFYGAGNNTPSNTPCIKLTANDPEPEPLAQNHALPCDTVSIAQLNADHTLANPYLNKLVHVKKVTFMKDGETFSLSYGAQSGWYWVKDEAGDSLYVFCADKQSGSTEDSWYGKKIPSKPQNITGVWDYGRGTDANDTCWRLVLRYTDFMEDFVSGLPSLDAPVLSVKDGDVYDNSVNVTISAAEDADIYYTLDGTTPSTSSTKYTAAIPITAKTTLKAIAVKAGHDNSDIVMATVWIRQPNPTPAGHIYLEEDMEKLRAGNISALSSHLDEYMRTPGWTGKNVSSPAGKPLYLYDYLISPELDLSQDDGHFYVAFKVANYTGLNNMKVTANGQTQSFAVRYEPNSSNPNYDYVVAEFTNGTANTKITFEKEARITNAYTNVLLDSIRVYQLRQPEIHVLTKVINLPAIATGSVTDTIRISGRFLESAYFLRQIKEMRSQDSNALEGNITAQAAALEKTFVCPITYKVDGNVGKGKDTAIYELKKLGGGDIIDSIFIYAETKECPKPTVSQTGKTSTTIDVAVSSEIADREYRIGTSGAWTAFTENNIQLTGFTPGGSFYYAVRAVCATGYYSESATGMGMMPASTAPAVSLVSPGVNSSFSDSVPVQFRVFNMVMGEYAAKPDTTQGRAYVEFSEVGGERVYKDSICNDTIGKFLLPSGKYVFKLEMKNIKTGTTIATLGGNEHYVTVALPKAAAPVFDSATNKVYYDSLLLALHGKAGDTIHYSLDTGKTFHVYSAPVKITGYKQHLVKAFVSNPRNDNSDTVSAVYTIRETVIKVAEPIFSVKSGSVVDTATTTIALSCATTGAKIYYAFGENVTPNTLYTLPIKLTADTTHITARAEVVGQTATYRSSLVSAVYYIKKSGETPVVIKYTLTVKANNDDYGTVTGGGEYEEGATATLTATPKDGYKFMKWDDGNTDNPRTVTVTAAATYTAEFAVASTPDPTKYVITVVASPEEGGTVTGGGEYVENTLVTLTATANQGYEFVKWNDEVTETTRQIKVVSDSSFTALFKAQTIVPVDTFYTVTVAASPAEGGTVTGGGRYKKDTVITLTATAKTGYHFVKWNDDSINNPLRIKVVKDCNFTAYFAIDSFNVTVVANYAEYGEVTGSGRYAYGDTATLTATPKDGYKFVKWNDGITENPRKLTVTSNATYTAEFAAASTPDPVKYTITVTASPAEGGVVTGGGEYAENTFATLTATAKEGYEFVKWNDEVTESIRQIKVVSDSTFTALFKEKTVDPQPVDTFYTITVVANNDEYGTVSGGGRFKKDTTVTIKAVAAAGYKFVEWEEDGVKDASREITVVADATYTAVFEKDGTVGVDNAAGVVFAVYPNPNDGRFTVEVAEDATMEIYNAAGVRVQSGFVPAGKRAVELRAAGIYFVKMTAGERTTVKRVIVR